MNVMWYLFNPDNSYFMRKEGDTEFVYINDVAYPGAYLFEADKDEWHLQNADSSWTDVEEFDVPDEIRMKLLLVME